jgi:nicotinamide-nucleotide amidase
VPERNGAAIFSLGTELTEGIIQDTHGRFLASLLTSWGIRVEKICQLRDAPEIQQELREEAARRRLIVCTGGLGPTSDDISREVIAAAAGRSLEFRSDLWDTIRQMYDLSKAEANKRQASIPQGFTVLPNEWGTAPGFWGEASGTLFIALPGPPRELHNMCDRYLGSILQEQMKAIPAGFTTATTFLVPESVLEDACSRNRLPGVHWRTRVEPYRIHLYVEGEREAERERFVQLLGSDLGSELVRFGDVEPARVLLREATARGKTIAAAESCTGGMLGARITANPGSSAIFWGTAVVYADEAKQGMLGVAADTLERSGAVSEAAAVEMAEGVLELSGADTAAAITGIAGPGGGSDEKPVGTVWIAVTSREQQPQARLFHFGNRRELVRRRSVVAALLMLEMMVKGNVSIDSVDQWHYS